MSENSHQSNSSKTVLRLGTRGSQLALWQSNWVKAQLEKHDVQIDLVIIKTEGDLAPGPLVQIGGQGLFTKAIQSALLENEIDIAVHSLKDLPTDEIAGLYVAAVPKREDSRDCLVCRPGLNWESLPDDAAIGTGSIRRQAQLLHLKPNLRMQEIRGNVDTRLKKVAAGEYDAIVLAVAGLKRLGWTDRITHSFESDTIAPAVGQGALGIEARTDDTATQKWLSKINDQQSYAAVIAEREMLRQLQGGCLAPIGAISRVETGELELNGVVLSKDGKEKISANSKGRLSEPEALGSEVAEMLISQGAKKMILG